MDGDNGSGESVDISEIVNCVSLKRKMILRATLEIERVRISYWQRKRGLHFTVFKYRTTSAACSTVSPTPSAGMTDWPWM